ncbi:hypothetical protein GYMLUDRAFT_68973 [Collybiopsis luxurians FD-317 M1]|nr:hypothetical protein GYMLUDRAFT_68973 [Collybiopsis luxurians FD-317 M1]
MTSLDPQFCRWGFICTRSFLSGQELFQHVVKDHVRTTNSVNHDEIPVLLRVTEGLGSSYQTEHFMSRSESKSQESKDASQDSNYSGPEASLPSPPMSTSSRPRKVSRDNRDKDSIFSRSYSSESRGQSPSPSLYLSDDDTPIHPPNIFLSEAIASPRFASLDASSGSPRPGSIPPSPTFSDIIACSTQKGPQSSFQRNQLLAPSASRDSTSSSESCAIVAAQLTPLNGADDVHNEVNDSGLAGASAPVGSNDGNLYIGELKPNANKFKATLQMPTTQRQGVYSNPPPNYGSIIIRQPASSAQNLPSVQQSVSSRPVSLEMHPRRQSWYAPISRKRSRGGGISPSVSPSDSPAVSPVGSSFGRQTEKLRARDDFPSQKTSHEIHDNRSNRSPHLKRLKLETSKTRRRPPREQESPQDNIDVSSMDTSGRYTLLPAQPQTVSAPEPYLPQSRYDMYDYPVLSQAPYDG